MELPNAELGALKDFLRRESPNLKRDDALELLRRLATECAVDCDPVNLAGGDAVTLVDLVRRIAELRGIDVAIEFDLSKPEGRARKQADLAKLRAKIPAFRITVTLDEGLRDMFEWYERTKAAGLFGKG